MLSQAVAVINGKGGTGKTSIVANVGGLLAAGENRVLLVDMDPQGNLSRDLGYADASDHGKGMFDAVMSGTPLAPLTDVRPGLDVVAGGARLEDLSWTLAGLTCASPMLNCTSRLRSPHTPGAACTPSRSSCRVTWACAGQ